MDSDEINLDGIRWGITLALLETAHVSDPTSAEKDLGYPPPAGGVGYAPQSEHLNAHRIALYRILLFLFGDLFPGAFPWTGILPSEPTGPVVTNPGGTFQVAAAARRYLHNGEILTVPAAVLPFNPNAASPLRVDLVVVTRATKVYEIVEGVADNVDPPINANQFAVARYGVVQNVGDTPQGISQIVPHPGRAPDRTGTFRYSLADMRFLALTLGFNVSVDDADGTIRLGTGGWVRVPIRLPPRATIDAVRMYGLKDAPATTDRGYFLELRRIYLGDPAGQPAPDVLEVADNDGSALSAVPFVLALGGPTTIDNRSAYELRVTPAAGNLLDGDNPPFWGFEVDYTLPL